MSLPPPAARELIHTRTVECRGYRRADGLWDIEAHMTDIKTYQVANKDRGGIPPGEPIHGMWLRLTIDEDFLIHDVAAFTEHSPYRICGDIAPRYGLLKGLRIGKGFNEKARDLFGGVHGCVHLLDLLRPLATTAYQTLWFVREQKRQETARATRPGVIDTCHALAADGPVVAREWPEFHTGTVTPVADSPAGEPALPPRSA